MSTYRHAIAARAEALAKAALSRMLVVHPFYVSRPQVWSAHLWEIDARLALCLERGFCYVRVPKAANTSVISTLYFHETGREPATRTEAKRFFRRPAQLARFSPARLEALFCFTFVRNPYDRLLSAYLSKLIGLAGRSPYRETARRVARRYGAGSLSFAAFCEYLRVEGMTDAHWLPQHAYVDAVRDGRLDFVGRVESLREDLAQVVRRLYGVADGTPHGTTHETGASALLGEHYDERSRAIVRELYREDFERFGYDPG